MTMSFDTLIAFAATAVAALFAVALLRRYVRRGRLNRALVYWALSLSMFALAALALAVGDVAGWTSGWFRVFYLFGGVLVVPWLALGTVQTVAPDRVTRRILGASSLVVAVLFVVPMLRAVDPSLYATGFALAGLWGLLLAAGDAGQVRAGSLVLVAVYSALATFAVLAGEMLEPIRAAPLPEGRDVFGAGVRGFAVGGNALASVLVVVGSVASAVRLRGKGAPHLLVGNLLIAVGVLVAAAGGTIAFAGDTTTHAIAFAIGVSLMYAGFVRTTRSPEISPHRYPGSPAGGDGDGPAPRT